MIHFGDPTPQNLTKLYTGLLQTTRVPTNSLIQEIHFESFAGFKARRSIELGTSQSQTASAPRYYIDLNMVYLYCRFGRKEKYKSWKCQNEQFPSCVKALISEQFLKSRSDRTLSRSDHMFSAKLCKCVYNRKQRQI